MQLFAGAKGDAPRCMIQSNKLCDKVANYIPASKTCMVAERIIAPMSKLVHVLIIRKTLWPLALWLENEVNM